MEEQQPEAAAAADPEAAAAAAAAAEKKRLKNQRKKQKQKAKKAAEEGEGGGGGAGAAAAEGAAEPEPAQGADGEAENDTALDAAALKKKEANRKKRERKKAKAAADKAAGPAWVEERLVQLKAERAARDAADEPKAVYPYKQWLDTSNGWSGPLRPAYVAPQRKVTDPDIAKPDYADDPDGTPHGEMEEMAGRSIKQLSEEEVKKMRVVCRMGREILDLAALAVRPGVRCDEIDTIVHEACMERKCYPSPLNYRKFPKSVCTSVNEVICHGVPDAYELKEGDICNIDVTVYYDGHHGDLNETYFVGEVDEATKHLVQVSYESLFKGIELVKPKELYRNVGNAVSKHCSQKGCAVVRTYTGHGINSLFHTAPNVPHYAKNKAVGMMHPGQTFTIEPMVNAGNSKDFTWPDDWTAVSQDGSRSAQFEHTMLCTENGVELLTARLPTSRRDVTCEPPRNIEGSPSLSATGAI